MADGGCHRSSADQRYHAPPGSTEERSPIRLASPAQPRERAIPRPDSLTAAPSSPASPTACAEFRPARFEDRGTHCMPRRRLRRERAEIARSEHQRSRNAFANDVVHRDATKTNRCRLDRAAALTTGCRLPGRATLSSKGCTRPVPRFAPTAAALARFSSLALAVRPLPLIVGEAIWRGPESARFAKATPDLSAAFPLPSRPVRCWCRRPTLAHSTGGGSNR